MVGAEAMTLGSYGVVHGIPCATLAALITGYGSAFMSVSLFSYQLGGGLS